MKKLGAILIVILFTLASIFPGFAAQGNASMNSDNITSSEELVYPVGDDFIRLKTIIDKAFSLSNSVQGYNYNCLLGGELCPNYRYTSIDEKAIKLIILNTYVGHEVFYAKLFSKQIGSRHRTDKELLSVKEIVKAIPNGTKLPDWRSLGFGRSSVSSDLLDASFGVDFMSQNTSSMLSAIEQKIKDMKRTKCTQQETGVNSSNDCPWNGVISDAYLPTPDELYAENVFLNRNSVKIGTLKDEFEYTLQMGAPIVKTETIQPSNATARGTHKGYMNGSMFIMTENSTLAQARDNCELNARNNPQSTVRCTWNDRDINTYPLDVSYTTTTTVPNILGYTLRYKKEYYTLEEAKDLIEAPAAQDIGGIYMLGSNPTSLPCSVVGSNIPVSECAQSLSDLRSVLPALGAYYADREIFPDSIEALTSTYVPKQEVLVRFKKNFSYRPTSVNQQRAFEIRYIQDVTIQTGAVASDKKDYTLLLSGATIPEIPQVFSYVPADSMVLYVKNPTQLISLLEYKNSDNKDMLLSTHKSIQNFIFSYFGIEDIDQLKANLTHELAVVVTNMDATAPDIVLILSEADKGALSPTTTTQAVSMRDGYIFVASSKDSLERVMNLTEKESIKDTPDFHYVWTKKADSIQDAFVFVGDAFFEKMLTMENYILHARKYTDYKNLRALQELVWAYKDAFGSAPKSLSEISQLGLYSLTGSVLDSYTLQGDRVQHKNIGTLDSLNTLNESGYNLSQISRGEVDTYKYNILKYREVWRAALDPMGIVLNRYGDGIDIDFFMTPIPDLQDNDLAELREFFEGTTKDSLSFVMDNRVRMGLLSLVGGFDIDKIQKKILTNPEIAEGFAEFSKEVLDGKNIFDYIGGEFAFTLGDIDADILDGWNVEKVDMYLSVQVASEEKGKEFVEAMRMNMLEKTNGGQSSELDMAKGFFAKPLIEEYAGKKIYYIDGASVPFVGKLGFAYTFVNDFFYIGLNRQTIKNIIDITKTGDSRKKEIVGTDAIQKNTFFAILFDGVQTSSTIKSLYEKNQKTLPRYLNSLGLGASSSNSQIGKLLGTYYATQDTNKRLGKKVTPFDYTVGGLTVSGDMDGLTARIDENALTSLTGEILEDWNTLLVSDGFQSGVLLDTGIPLEQFLNMNGVDDIIAMSLIVSLQNKFDSGESLLKNTVFSLSMGDDEIGFKVRIFEKKENTEDKKSLGSIIPEDIPQDVFVIILILVALGLVGGIGYILYKKKESENSASPISQNPSISTSPIVPATSSPIDITQPPLPPTGTTENL